MTSTARLNMVSVRSRRFLNESLDGYDKSDQKLTTWRRVARISDDTVNPAVAESLNVDDGILAIEVEEDAQASIGMLPNTLAGPGQQASHRSDVAARRSVPEGELETYAHEPYAIPATSRYVIASHTMSQRGLNVLAGFQLIAETSRGAHRRSLGLVGGASGSSQSMSLVLGTRIDCSQSPARANSVDFTSAAELSERPSQIPDWGESYFKMILGSSPLSIERRY